MVSSLEGFNYLILVVSQLVSLLAILGKISWDDYLVQIVG